MELYTNSGLESLINRGILNEENQLDDIIDENDESDEGKDFRDVFYQLRKTKSYEIYTQDKRVQDALKQYRLTEAQKTVLLMTSFDHNEPPYLDLYNTISQTISSRGGVMRIDRFIMNLISAAQQLPRYVSEEGKSWIFSLLKTSSSTLLTCGTELKWEIVVGYTSTIFLDEKIKILNKTKRKDKAYLIALKGAVKAHDLSEFCLAGMGQKVLLDWVRFKITKIDESDKGTRIEADIIESKFLEGEGLTRFTKELLKSLQNRDLDDLAKKVSPLLRFENFTKFTNLNEEISILDNNKLEILKTKLKDLDDNKVLNNHKLSQTEAFSLLIYLDDSSRTIIGLNNNNNNNNNKIVDDNDNEDDDDITKDIIDDAMIKRDTPKLEKNKMCILYLLSCIRKLETVTGRLYAQQDYDKDLSMYKKDYTNVWTSFTIATTKVPAKSTSEHTLYFEITGDYVGYDISEFVGSSGYKTVILEPETKFVVKKVNKTNYTVEVIKSDILIDKTIGKLQDFTQSLVASGLDNIIDPKSVKKDWDFLDRMTEMEKLSALEILKPDICECLSYKKDVGSLDALLRIIHTSFKSKPWSKLQITFSRKLRDFYNSFRAENKSSDMKVFCELLEYLLALFTKKTSIFSRVIVNVEIKYGIITNINSAISWMRFAVDKITAASKPGSFYFDLKCLRSYSTDNVSFSLYVRNGFPLQALAAEFKEFDSTYYFFNPMVWAKEGGVTEEEREAINRSNIVEFETTVNTFYVLVTTKGGIPDGLPKDCKLRLCRKTCHSGPLINILRGLDKDDTIISASIFEKNKNLIYLVKLPAEKQPQEHPARTNLAPEILTPNPLDTFLWYSYPNFNNYAGTQYPSPNQNNFNSQAPQTGQIINNYAGTQYPSPNQNNFNSQAPQLNQNFDYLRPPSRSQSQFNPNKTSQGEEGAGGMKKDKRKKAEMITSLFPPTKDSDTILQDPGSSSSTSSSAPGKKFVPPPVRPDFFDGKKSFTKPSPPVSFVNSSNYSPSSHK